MPKDRFREKLGALFADVERLAADPAGVTPQLRRELDKLRARLSKLEAQFLESETRAAEQERAPGPVSAEPEPVAETRPEPHGGIRPIGKVQVESPPERKWTPEEAALLEAVAQRASQQIENLRLLEATKQARAEAEAATRRFMHESWGSFLDAIHHSERVGYAYDQTSVTPFLDKPNSDGYQENVQVMEEQVGTVYLQPDPFHPLTEEDKAMVNSIAKQIAQQVENIRLLADASRARAEAEEATRRSTRESWQAYASQQEAELGFAYDANQVVPLKEVALPQETIFAQPLTVRGEPIGRLAVSGWKEIPPEAAELMAAIASQASIHLETLRLNEELRKRAAELQELDRLKSAFLANMSHELRTPLNSILGFADVMIEELDGPLTENMASDLKLIQKNGQHLLHLINDVLDMAKIESGRMNLYPEKFRVQDILEETLSITSALVDENKISLCIEKDSDVEVQIKADRARIRQVMINLVNNSIKFTESGKISICAEHIEERVRIAVRDTGVGIPADQLETIFQEFTQLDTSLTRKAGGTGLGLPISRKLIEMHGGRLWAESPGVAGEGSIFIVELPLEAVIVEPVEIERVQK